MTTRSPSPQAPPPLRMRRAKWVGALLLGLVPALLVLAPPARAQAPGPGAAAQAAPAAAPGAAPGAAAAAAAPAAQRPGTQAQNALGGPLLGSVQFRMYLPLIDQMSFTLHPFYQITGDSSYIGASAPTALFLHFSSRQTDVGQDALVRLIHSLPALGVEWVMGVDYPFPRGVGVGIDYTPLSQQDVGAATSGTVTPIAMDAYYYTGTLRFYFFDPTAPGVNYFLGLGLGFITGNIKATVGTASPQYISFAEPSVGSTRFGLETHGDHWGFRYELAVLHADNVNLKSNPYPAGTTKLDFSGSLIRATLFYQF